MAKFKIIKKNGSQEGFDAKKVITAVRKSASRVMVTLNQKQEEEIIDRVVSIMESTGRLEFSVLDMHMFVIRATKAISREVSDSYSGYRNYKEDFVHILDDVYTKYQSTKYHGDKSNANADSTLVSTQRSLLCGEISKEIYKKFYLSKEELEAINDGYIYIHDLSHRLTSHNCAVLDAAAIMTDGFEMGNVWYNEPKSIDTACDVLGDVIMCAASQQYGGLTIKADDVLAKYCEKTFEKYKETIKSDAFRVCSCLEEEEDLDFDCIERLAKEKTVRDLEQGIQGLEYKLNTVSSARGDYAFVSFAFGDNLTEWGQQVTKSLLKVRKEGQGKPGYTRPQVFPKLIMLYRSEWYGQGAPFEYTFDEAIDCSSKAQYPDYFSLEPGSYAGDIYEKYHEPIIVMGCVDGDQHITYRIGEHIVNCSFAEAWDSLQGFGDVKEQKAKGNYYIDLSGVEILDRGKFVKCKRIIKNNTTSGWYEVTFNDSLTIKCTSDHPWPIIGRGRTETKYLNVGFRLDYGVENGLKRPQITDVRKLEGFNGFSYDVTTESDRFDVSGISSHNCRSHTTPWFKNGGLHPADENDQAVLLGRANAGK